MRTHPGLRLVVGFCLLAGSNATAQPAAAPPAPAPQGAPRASADGRGVDLALVGLIVRDVGEPLAIIEDRKTRKQGLYKVGMLVRGWRLAKILEDRVVIELPDGEVELRLATTPAEGASPASPPPSPIVVVPQPETPPPPAPSEPAGDASPFPRIDRANLDQLIRAPDLLMNVTATENQGVRVGEVRKSSLFEVLGLRRGDLIRNVNGRVPGAADSLSQVIEQAVETGMLRFELERNGQMDVKYIQIRP